MALISIILSLILDRLLKEFHDLRDPAWFQQYSCFLGNFIKVQHGWLKLFVVLVLPILLFVLLQFLLYGVFWNIPYILFGIFVLFFSLGSPTIAV